MRITLAVRVVGGASRAERISTDGGIKRGKPSLTSLVAFAMLAALPVVYVLSYAPVVLLHPRTAYNRVDKPERLADASLYPAYAPVDWMIDNTPLQEPLLVWADMWSVRMEFEYGLWTREWESPLYDENGTPLNQPATIEEQRW